MHIYVYIYVYVYIYIYITYLFVHIYIYIYIYIQYTNLSRCSKQIRSFATFSLFEMIFLRFSTVSVRSTVRSNCPPVVGVMLIVISSGSRTVAATQPHPGCSGDVEEEDDNDDDEEDNEEEFVGSGETEPALIER